MTPYRRAVKRERITKKNSKKRKDLLLIYSMVSLGACVQVTIAQINSLASRVYIVCATIYIADQEAEAEAVYDVDERREELNGVLIVSLKEREGERVTRPTCVS